MKISNPLKKLPREIIVPILVIMALSQLDLSALANKKETPTSNLQKSRVESLLSEPIIEDYSDSIGLRFCDKLRISQQESERLILRAKSIACQEGYYKKGTLAQRNRNAGNLKKSGTPHDKYGHSIFRTDVEGWLALYQLLYKYKHLTLEELGTFYATDPNWARGVRSCYKNLINIK